MVDYTDTPDPSMSSEESAPIAHNEVLFETAVIRILSKSKVGMGANHAVLVLDHSSTNSRYPRSDIAHAKSHNQREIVPRFGVKKTTTCCVTILHTKKILSEENSCVLLVCLDMLCGIFRHDHDIHTHDILSDGWKIYNTVEDKTHTMGTPRTPLLARRGHFMVHYTTPLHAQPGKKTKICAKTSGLIRHRTSYATTTTDLNAATVVQPFVA